MLKHFKANKTKVLVKHGLLARTECGWTTNGQWMILTKHEPKWLQKVKSNDFRAYNIDSVIKNALKDSVDVEFTNQLRYIESEDTIATKIASRDFTSWFNVYFLAIFSHLHTDYQQQSEVHPLIIKNFGEIVGLVMPMKVE